MPGQLNKSSLLLKKRARRDKSLAGKIKEERQRWNRSVREFTGLKMLSRAEFNAALRSKSKKPRVLKNLQLSAAGWKSEKEELKNMSGGASVAYRHLLNKTYKDREVLVIRDSKDVNHGKVIQKGLQGTITSVEPMDGQLPVGIKIDGQRQWIDADDLIIR